MLIELGFLKKKNAAAFIKGAPILSHALIYLGFQVKFAADEIADGFGTFIVRLGESVSGLAIKVSYNPGLASWVYAIGGSSDVYAQAITADTYVTVELQVETSTGGITLTPRFDGFMGTPVSSSSFTTPPNELDLGAIETAGGLNDRTFDNVTLGTTTWGTTDLFSANFSTGPVPPFDSVVGATVTVASGEMNISCSGSECYVVKAF